MAIREGAWDCSICGRAGNRGPEKYCAGCGHPRGTETELYLPEEAPEVTDAAKRARARAGPDWTCPHCEGDNRAEYRHCTGCGAPRDGAPTRRVVEHRDRAPAAAAPAPPRPVRRLSRARRRQLKKDYRRRSKRSRRPIAIGCLALVAVVALLTYLGRTTDATATVSGFGWERTAEVEALLTVIEQSRASEVPEGARLLSAPGAPTRTVTERVQVGTERVKVGVRDLGNGYFEDIYEERPVYETRRRQVPVRGPPGGKVRYQIERWSKVREERAAGRDRSPRWPEVDLGPKERAGARTEKYTVYLTGSDGRRLTYRARSEQEWLGIRAGRKYEVEATKTGSVSSLSPS